ncbi:N-acetylmuramoyl-L-alanine amidase [Streptomyces sp. ISL-12]|uniref:peptidoglycan-binding protein n=1 Tax=Streptomyces sp. ISL-12 TaxID=2819177 RepID=UPI001BEA23AD|nr:peptidoglycan-binding protein [Streptomyces sp. ISL-12]MBT2409563.1 N-acetylmuramoyl-L-alanine amidase [Streptomyces sp. ISL-12]
MATPLTADTLVTALTAEGVTVVEHGDWRTHNRNSVGTWGPVNGVMVHHTVTSGTTASVDLCYDGTTDLPGPLCHGVIDKDGTVYLVGNGRANHAGLGDTDVLTAVIAETALPAPDSDDVDGNTRFYGFECVNLGDGSDPWPEAQLEAIARVCAAICRAHGWNAASVIGHLEWTFRKIDPRGFSMASMRTRVAALLATAPGGSAAHYQPFPGDAFFKSAPNSTIVAAMGGRLVAEGCSAYTTGPGPQWSEADRASYALWQQKLGYTGADADGWPGATSWNALKVPYTA